MGHNVHRPREGLSSGWKASYGEKAKYEQNGGRAKELGHWKIDE